ncbi:MAG: TonB-dependent receptor [Paludibacteraceae bacterium]|nr:TonB-dependent receptor [Paludibacteraceae bacterium]
MKQLLTLICLLSLTLTTYAAQITGKVIDAGSKQPIDFANVSVVKNGDTAPVGGSITDETGAFDIEVADGQYTVIVSFMGYTEQRRDITVAGKPINLGRIALKEDTQVLQDVEVVGQNSSMRFELDKKVFTVDQNIASAGASVTDVLENIPSVDVDQEGNISLRNSEDVEIWINGKPAGLNSENRGQVLQQMPAGTIEKIELITNPSAKYSPEGTSGIINLVMKKDRAAGYYGSVQAGLDYALSAPWNVPPGGNVGFNINFNAGPVDGYFNVGYRYRISNGGSKTDRYNLGQGNMGSKELDSTLIQSHLLQEGLQTRRGGGLFARAGLNFHVAEHSTIGVSGFGMVSDPNVFNNRNTNHRTILQTLPDGIVMRDYTRDQNGVGYHPGGNATLDYTFELDNHKLMVSGTYNNFGWNQLTDYTQIERNMQKDTYDTTYQDQSNYSKNQGIEIKADYEWKPTPQSRLEAGYDYTRNWNNSSADAHNIINGEKTEIFPYYTTFDGLTQNHALYITYGNRFFDRLSIQVGLRGEYYMRHLESFYKDDAGDVHDAYAAFPNKKDTAYFQVFPSAYISYDFGNGHELQLNYTRRINRPWGHQINPRMDFSDSTNISYGNVDLLPAYSNNLELNYLKTWERHTLSAGVFWKYREGAVQNFKYMDPDAPNVMKNTYFNVGSRQELGVEVVAKNRLFGEILQLTTSANFYWNNIAAVDKTITHQGIEIPVNLPAQNIFAGSVRINAQFMFTKQFSGQISANYRSPRVVAQGTTSHSYSIDIGLRHTFLNKQLALALNVRDLLDSRARRNTTWGDGFWQFSENRWHSRTISLTLTYNFGNQTGKRRNRQGDDFGGGDDGDDSGNGGGDYE